ncbi:MAG: leucyl aminopeptidase [Rubrivivax sp.]
MDFRTLPLSASSWSRADADALMIVLAADADPGLLDKPLAALWKGLCAAGELELKAGKCVLVLQPAKVQASRVVFCVAASASAKAMAKAFSAGLALLKGGGTRTLHVAVLASEGPTPAQAEALAVTAQDAVYLYRHTKPSAPAAPALDRVSLVCPAGAQAALQAALARGAAIGQGVTLARECANRPGNHCTPTFLAEEARRLGRTFGLKVQVLERKDVEKLGMGAFLAVAQGSAQPLKFIVAQWQGAGRRQAPIVLVGKGITFDTGGISLKPAAEMDEMKFDMGGAASVLGTLRALAELKAQVNVVGLIAATENMPGGRAVKPGDVVTSMSGQTIEILNTDAEGRLILCDALTYAQRFKPAAVVDIATLTGACVIALGHQRSGLFSPDDALAEELLQAGDAALDPCWRMPVDDEYDEALKSSFADMGNVGPRAGGAITAAMFLKRFAGAYRWAHLDIAGTVWKSGAAKGATGRPVPLLTHFILGRAA